jgi:hypothetical protein
LSSRQQKLSTFFTASLSPKPTASSSISLPSFSAFRHGSVQVLHSNLPAVFSNSVFVLISLHLPWAHKWQQLKTGLSSSQLPLYAHGHRSQSSLSLFIYPANQPSGSTCIHIESIRSSPTFHPFSFSFELLNTCCHQHLLSAHSNSPW